MSSMPEQIMEFAEASPEGFPLRPKDFLHLGSRPAVHQAFSRLARKDRLRRIFQGVYMRTVETRFGRRGPSVDKAIPELSELWGEVIVPSGGAAANLLGLTDQVPMRRIYLTSGPDRRLVFGARKVDLRHAPNWQLVAPYRPSGTLVRALTFLSREEVEDALGLVASKLSDVDIAELLAVREILPVWIAEPLNVLESHVQ